MARQFKIKKGDMACVISGKDKGKWLKVEKSDGGSSSSSSGSGG